MGRNSDSVRADNLMYDLAKANQHIAELEGALFEKAEWPLRRTQQHASPSRESLIYAYLEKLGWTLENFEEMSQWIMIRQSEPIS